MGSVGIDCGFWLSRDGIFKSIIFICSLLILILTSASGYATTTYQLGDRKLPTGQMAYVNFVASYCCITLLISAVIYVFKLYNMPLCGRLPWLKLEIIYALSSALLNLISIGVAGHAAANTTDWNRSPPLPGLFAAGAVFSAIVFLLFLLHAFLLYRGDPPVSETKPSHGGTSVNT